MLFLFTLKSTWKSSSTANTRCRTKRTVWLPSSTTTPYFPLTPPTTVHGKPLQQHTENAGFHKDGYCRTGPSDKRHLTIVATLTHSFLQCEYGDDDYKGLKAGQKTCISAYDFRQAVKEMGPDTAPKVDLNATHDKALDVIGLDELKKYASKK